MASLLHWNASETPSPNSEAVEHPTCNQYQRINKMSLGSNLKVKEKRTFSFLEELTVTHSMPNSRSAALDVRTSSSIVVLLAKSALEITRTTGAPAGLCLIQRKPQKQGSLQIYSPDKEKLDFVTPDVLFQPECPLLECLRVGTHFFSGHKEE